MILVKRKINLFAAVVVLISISCHPKKYEVVYDNESVNDKSRYGEHLLKIYQDSLMVFFESGFDTTPIMISVDGTVLTCDTITTSNINIAEVKSLGLRSRINRVKLNIDGGNDINIKIDSTFRFFTVNYSHKIVRIRNLNKYPTYE